MLCSRHVVFRQSVRPCLARLASTTTTAAAAAEPPKLRGPGRPRKVYIETVAEQGGTRAQCAANATVEIATRRGPGRPRKTAIVGDAPRAVVDAQAKPSPRPRKTGPSDAKSSTADGSITQRAKGKPVRAVKTKSAKPRPSRLTSPRPLKHHDLPSFLEYAAKTGLNENSCVYKGHHYEYTVAETLRQWDFTLEKVGRTNDLGIDLVGTWYLPTEPRDFRVVIQCKASKPRPAFVRELEGASCGAPAGWKDRNVMALLITRDGATDGVRKALNRSQQPMGFAQITELGEMKQLIWNPAAQELRLTPLTVTNVYGSGAASLLSSSAAGGRLTGIISLRWMDQPWPGAKQSLVNLQRIPAESRSQSRLTA